MLVVKIRAIFTGKALPVIPGSNREAGIVENASDWQWSSFIQRQVGSKPFPLDPGPILIPQNWPQIVNKLMPEEETAQLTNCIKRGCPYGDEEWTAKTAKELDLESTLKKSGRPPKWK